jgi:hypothetical protein
MRGKLNVAIMASTARVTAVVLLVVCHLSATTAAQGMDQGMDASDCKSLTHSSHSHSGSCHVVCMHCSAPPPVQPLDVTVRMPLQMLPFRKRPYQSATPCATPMSTMCAIKDGGLVMVWSSLRARSHQLGRFALVLVAQTQAIICSCAPIFPMTASDPLPPPLHTTSTIGTAPLSGPCVRKHFAPCPVARAQRIITTIHHDNLSVSW